MPRLILIIRCKAITYILLCGSTPFRSDDMKEIVRQTTEARINLHNRYWKNMSDEGTPWIIDKQVHSLSKSAYMTLDPGTQQQRASSAPCSIQTPRTACSRPSVGTYVTHKLRCANRTRPIRSARIFEPRPRWRSANSTARALSRFAKHKGANHHNDRLAIINQL
jgi:calcium/calmodulin-dependent protein kinase I